MQFKCHSYVNRMYSYVTRMSFVCHSYVLVCHSYVTRMSFLCHSYVLVCHSYVSRMYRYVIRVPLVCTRMSFVYHSCALVCHSYVTRLWFYHEPPNIQGFSSFVIDRKFVKLKEISDEKHILNVQFFTFSTYIHRRHMKIEAF